jgi:hypothetical protein
MKKVLIAVGASLLALVILLIVSGEIADHIYRNRLDSRRAHWTAVVRREVPVGATRNDVAQWAKRTFPQAPGDRSPIVDPDWPTASFMVETFPVRGFTFPCAAWSIVIEIDFDVSGHVTGRKVDEVGACV